MAEDYHIYIHGSYGNASTGSPAKPSNFRSGSAQSGAAKPWQRYAQFITNPDSLIGVAKQKAQTYIQNSYDLSETAAKVVPWVAIVMAAAKIADSIITTGTSMLDAAYGGGRTRVYNNFKQPLQWITKPFSTSMGAITTAIRVDRENTTKWLNAELLGDSQLNSDYRRRV